MYVTAVLFAALWALASTDPVVYFELEGHLTSVTYSDVTPGHSAANHQVVDRISQELSASLKDGFVGFYVSDFQIHGVEAGKPTAIFHGFLTLSTGLTRQQIVYQVTANGDLKLYYLAGIENLPPIQLLDEDNAAAVYNCSNGGILLPNNTCICPPFVSGAQCELISCQHFGILDKNRCTCPPGAYGLNCETRGCLPGVQSNLDTSHQSFILVLNLRSSMAYDLHQLIGQMPVWLTDIGKAAPGLVDNFIVTTYLQYKNSYYMKNNIFTTSDQMVDYLNAIVISAGDTDQPTVSAISSAQSFSSLMHPSSVVYVFADSAASDGDVFNPKLSSTSAEMLAVQRTLSWRNRVAVFLSETDDTPMDYFGDEYDVLRRVVSATHGDLIVFEKTSIVDIIDRLLPYYYQMENMAALYGVNPENDVEVQIRADYPSQVVYILVTAENAAIPGILDQNGVQPTAETSGKYYKLIRTTATATMNVTITAKKQSSVNVRVWINSPNTVFVASHPDPTVDVGSAVASADLPGYTTAYVGGFPRVDTLTYATYDVGGQSTGTSLNGNLTRDSECTFPFIFPTASKACTPGAFVQVLSIFDGTSSFDRMVPGFCGKSDYPSPVPFSCLNGGSALSSSSCNCTSYFSGTNCGTPVCLNGGVVEVFPGNGRGLCECPHGYSGDHCELLSCSAPSSQTFDASRRSLAVVIESTFSQAELNSRITSGLTALLKYMGQADEFNEYLLTTFNTVTVQNASYEVVRDSTYPDAASFLNAISSSSIEYQNSQSVTQPSLDALLVTINGLTYDKSSIFLFTDAPANTVNLDVDVSNIVLAAVERQLQISIIITAPYQMNDLCLKSPDVDLYTKIALQTGGTILNLCQPYVGTYPRDLITEFFTGYGITHHHVETLNEAVSIDCRLVNDVTFYVDDPSTQVYAFVNSDQVESFAVELYNLDLGVVPNQLSSTVQMPFFGIYEVIAAVHNTKGYVLKVSSKDNQTEGSCSIRIVEKTQLAVYLGFTTNPSRDSPSLSLNYAIPYNPVVHVSSQFQADVQPKMEVYNSDGTLRYFSTGVRRMPTCHYESFFSVPFACADPYSYFVATVTITTNETTVQRAQRAYCYKNFGVCLNGGSPNEDGTCACQANFNGPSCENPICQNDGRAKDYTCICEPGFNGEFCQYVACDSWNYLETHDVRQHEFRQGLRSRNRKGPAHAPFAALLNIVKIAISIGTRGLINIGKGLFILRDGRDGKDWSDRGRIRIDLCRAVDKENRKITFVIERNIGMVMPSIYLQQMIASFVAASESNDIPKQYSLITFDENVVTNVVSTSHTDRFVSAFNDAMGNFTNSDPTATKLIDAIQEAYKITIQPPSVIYAFTSHDATKVSTSLLKQRLGTQVNVFYMQLLDYPQQPTGFYIPMIVRQSGGRLLPLTVLATRSMSNVLNSIIRENALIYDDGFRDCTAAQSVSFFVESSATRLVLDVTGNDVSSAGAVTVVDGQGNPVKVNLQNALLTDAGALVIDFALQSISALGGQWTVSVQTTSGSCFVQVRAESPVHVIPGFTSSPDQDFVKSGPFSKLGTNSSTYVTTRVTNSRDTNYGVTMDSLSIAEADFSAPWNDKLLMGQSIHPRDSAGCASQFVTAQFASPTTTYQRYIVTGTDASKTKFQRTFFYTQPAASDSAPQCVYGTRNIYGECICDDTFTGDYCADRICLNGGTASVGVCACVNGYYGDFCEQLLSNTAGASTTASPVL